jgi:hypothetical protein
VEILPLFVPCFLHGTRVSGVSEGYRTTVDAGAKVQCGLAGVAPIMYALWPSLERSRIPGVMEQLSDTVYLSTLLVKDGKEVYSIVSPTPSSATGMNEVWQCFLR